MGLLALLDEESRFPRATDVSLATKLHGNFKSSHYYQQPKDNGANFTIQHYAGPVSVFAAVVTPVMPQMGVGTPMQVMYDTTGFLEKNRDTLRPELTTMLGSSHNAIMRALFSTAHLTHTGNLALSPVPKAAQPSATPLFGRRAPGEVALKVIGRGTPEGGGGVLQREWWFGFC